MSGLTGKEGREFVTPLPHQADLSDQTWCLSGGAGTSDYECPGTNCSSRYPECNTTLYMQFPELSCFASVLEGGSLLLPCTFFRDNATLNDALLEATTVQNAVLFIGAYLQAAIPDSLESLVESFNVSLKKQFWNYDLYYNSTRNVSFVISCALSRCCVPNRC